MALTSILCRPAFLSLLAITLLLDVSVPLLGQESASAKVGKQEEEKKETRPRFKDHVSQVQEKLKSSKLTDPIVFVGSSTIRSWSLEKSFAGMPVLNHGIGGAKLEDLNDHFDTLFGAVKAKVFVVYCGDNDIGAGKTADEHVVEANALIARIRSVHPDVPILWIGIKPSIKRWAKWPEMQRANLLIGQLCRSWPLMEMIDVAPLTLNKEQQPEESIFKTDGLHLNEAGYERWSGAIKPVLARWTSDSKDSSGAATKDYQWAWTNREIVSAGTRFWPQFRGPAGDGMVRGKAPPTKWSETENVVWKLPIEGRAWSSPVIWGNKIWLTNSSNDGKKMSVLAIDFDSGKVLLDLPLFENQEVQVDHHKMNSYASPTALLDGEYVYVTFGAYGTACLKQSSGEVVWSRRDLPCNHYRGPGSSPVLYKNLLIFHMDGFDYKYVIALDRATGKTVWKVDRKVEYGTDDGDVHKAYATPTLIDVAGAVEMVSPTSKATIAYNPDNGEEIWRVRYNEFSTTAKAMFDGDRLFLNSGFSKALLMSLRPGQGDLTDKILWRQDRGIGCKPSQLLQDGLIYNIDDEGIASCIDAANGEQVWQKRLGGEFSSSVMSAGGNIYLFDHEGKGYVFKADRSGTLVSENQLDDGCMATPAVVDGQMILRTRSALYRIGSSQESK